MRIRAYQPTDRSACVTLFESNVPRYFREWEQNEFSRFLDSSGCAYYVLETPGRIVACGGFGSRDDTTTSSLCWGMVDSALHKLALGKILLVARLHLIAQLPDIATVILGTSQLTEGFFRKFGFTVVSKKPDGIDQGLDDVQMAIALTERNRQRINRQWQETSDRYGIELTIDE